MTVWTYTFKKPHSS